MFKHFSYAYLVFQTVLSALLNCLFNVKLINTEALRDSKLFCTHQCKC